MKLKEVKETIQKSLGIGINFTDLYMREFKKLYKGDKRAIDGFECKYSDGGNSVTFVVNACGETVEFTTPVIKWSERKNK